MIVVIGSINLDFIYTSGKFPLKGETLVGTNLELSPGGKGANQAFHSAKFSPTKLIGGIGEDTYASQMLKHLGENGINTESIKAYPGPTGSAFINIAEGDNKIVIIPGANGALKYEDIIHGLKDITSEDFVLIQNEIDVDILSRVCDYLVSIDVKYVYNPAPYVEVAESIYKNALYITPNETEYQQFSQKYGNKYDEKVIITQGSKGVKLLKGNINIPCNKVEVVDTTGAGDAFSGTFTALVGKYGVEEATKIACDVATETVKYKGAQGVKLKF